MYEVGINIIEVKNVVELESIFRHYIDSVEQLHRSVNPLRSALGLREAEIHYSGHMDFYSAVDQWIDAFLQGPIDEDTIEQALEIILFTAAKYKKSTALWYLIAVQEFSKPLIKELPKERKDAIRNKYKKAYPRGKRLPLQNDIYKLLGTIQKFC